MNTPSFGKFSPRWLAGKRGLIVTLLAGLAILALGRGMNLPAREVYRERQIRQLEEDAQWVAERLERRMNIPAPQREATWPLAAMRAALQTLAQERHYQLLLVNGDGHLLAASHALPASVLAQVQAQFPREMQPPLFGSHYQTIQPFAPHQRMLSRALNGNAGLAGWNLVMLGQRAAGAEAGGARQAKTLIANRAVRDGESAGWRAGSAEAAPGPDRRSAG
ncbi:hypothetical protein BA196_01610 [Klebsiella pneumoniae]|nr:hypothetical protein [Klebsiella pneumoniae]OCL23787.1 hypothetical protein BA196_01610 [Klebsiella pneumoniae]